ncbi:MAG: choice-of-anchor D domain-containing protein [Caldilineaceae bacterium]
MKPIQQLLALCVALSLLIAPLTPLPAGPAPRLTEAASPLAALWTGAADLLSLSNLYSNLFVAPPIAAQTSAPGGVAGNLQFWAKADAGAQSGGAAAANGDQIDLWLDQSGNGVDAAQADANKRPTFVDGANANFNFNPTMDYPESQDELVTPLDINPTSAGFDPMTGFIVYELDTGTGAIALWGNDNGAMDRWVGATHYADGVSQDPYSGGNATNIPLLNSTIFDDGVGGSIFINGKRVVNDFVNGQDGGATSTAIGGVGPNRADWTFDGRIAEVAFYDTELTPAQRQQVETYLALRYGITLDATDTNGAIVEGDYVATDGAKVWDSAANSAYHNDVAGIGRDDAEALDQRKSRSVNSGGVVTIDNGAAFSADKSYLIWGNNGQAASYGAGYTPTSFSPAAGYFRMNRVWKVAETGTVSTVSVMHPIADHLLVSSDPNFASGVTEVALSGGSATIDFTNGQYFTFGKELTAPGGVAGNMQFWAKANAGAEANGTAAADGSLVDIWRDQSGNEIDATQGDIAKQPTFVGGAWANFNFNPTIDYPESRDELVTPLNINAISAGFDPLTAFIVYELDTGTGAIALWGNDTFGDRWAGATHYGNGGGNVSYSGGNTTGTPLVHTTRFKHASATGASIYINGERLVNNAAINDHNTGATSTAIGGVGPNRADWTFDGRIAEVAFYNTELTPAQRQQVETYLALKYGITLDTTDNDGAIVEGNYVAPDGSKVWDSVANSAYHNDVVGIGRDDAEDLDQQKSKSVNSGSIVTIDNGGPFVADQSYLLWGNNNAATTLSANYNGGANNRLARVWKVAEAGTVGAVKLLLPRSVASSTGLRSLLVHASDPNFGTVDRVYVLTVNGGNYEATVDFNDGDYFTFASITADPKIDVTPGSIDFGTVETGSTSAAETVTILNQGDVSLSITNISLGGADAGQFAISNNNCGASVGAGDSCTVELTFTPASSGAKNAFLAIDSNDSDEGTVNVVLNGTGPTITGPGASAAGETYNLAVTKSATVLDATPGTPFDYTLTVFNTGSVAASNVVLTDQLPSGVTYNSASATAGGACNQSAGTVTCTWATLASGTSATVTITVTP